MADVMKPGCPPTISEFLLGPLVVGSVAVIPTAPSFGQPVDLSFGSCHSYIIPGTLSFSLLPPDADMRVTP
jgi:hypothetical protein